MAEMNFMELEPTGGSDIQVIPEKIMVPRCLKRQKDYSLLKDAEDPEELLQYFMTYLLFDKNCMPSLDF